MINLIKQILDTNHINPREVVHENLLVEVYDIVWKLVRVQKIMLFMQFATIVCTLLLLP